ncbi:quinone oxidoreductase family protein [Loigolactobacillus binensis]|uniref:Zinc-binding alcohol dehydrogenase family protein n=1 Tax=Loigolactobacillus binensis TaxID=2559922 RepID=A0ABW3EF50_9LACO|nr:zinc-binding alcohol dehydrogenase family protein [Loigolactobacillus binensis]
MKAAVVTTFDQKPQYQDFPAPTPKTNQELIHVLAASVNHRVQAQADGSHYTSDGQLPLIPGLDGVGRLADGRLAYFVTSDPVYGALAEQTVTDRRRIIPLAADTDAAKVAASMNPAMSSWMALKDRFNGDLAGKKVLILGATGHAGSLAIQISRYLGATTVIAVGRNQQKLAQLPADQKVSLLANDDDFTTAIAANADADIVLDYLWGEAARRTMLALLPARKGHQLLTWIEIGSMAGAALSLPAAALRAVDFTLIGSGQGSIAPQTFLRELPELARLLSQGQFNTASTTLPLAQVTANWTSADDKRLVFTMNEA